MTTDPFEILGVPRTATDHDIAAAYRSLARQFHPDAHPEATPDEKTVYETAMARINAAYGDIGTPVNRERWLREERFRARPGSAGRTGSDRPPSPYRPPGPGECTLCGSAPAEPFTFHHQVGMIVASQRATTDATLCRLCAQAVGRSVQNRTLVTGWWGLLAFFTNFAVVIGNAAQLRRAHRLAPPRPVADVVGRAPGPMHPGPPVHRRGGIYVAAVVLAFVTVMGIGAVRSQPSSSGTGGTGGTGGGGGGGGAPTAVADGADWSEGNCVRGQVTAVAVRCSSRHDGRIIADVANLLWCPPGTDTYVQIRTTYHCIDQDR